MWDGNYESFISFLPFRRMAAVVVIKLEIALVPFGWMILRRVVLLAYRWVL